MASAVVQTLPVSNTMQVKVETTVEGNQRETGPAPKFGERFSKTVKKIHGVVGLFYNDSIETNEKTWKKLDPDLDIGTLIKEHAKFKADNKKLKSELTKAKNRLASLGLAAEAVAQETK